MHNQNTRKKATALGVELLEDRTVPTTFGLNQGESLAVGDVIPNNSLTPGGSDYEYVTGTGPGTLGVVKVYDDQGNMKYQVTPFAGWTGGVYVAVGEVTRNLTSPANIAPSDVVPGASTAANGIVTITTILPHGYTAGQVVRIQGTGAAYDGEFTILDVPSPTTFRYWNFFFPDPVPDPAGGGTAGVYQKDIIVSTGPGGTGRVRVYEFIGNQLRSQALLFPYGPNYVGGIQLATSNVNGDFHEEIVMGMATNGSVIKVFAADPTSAGKTYFENRKFKAFEDSYRGGVSLAAANVDQTLNNGFDTYNYNFGEVIVGKAKDAPIMRIFDAQLPVVDMRAEYFTFDANTNRVNQGINIAAGNTDGIRGAEIYVSLKGGTTARVYEGQTGVPIGDVPVNYPDTFGNNLEIAVNDLSDFVGPNGHIASVYAFLFTDIFVVAGDGPFLQVPVVFPGIFGTPAGFNGSRGAP